MKENNKILLIIDYSRKAIIMNSIFVVAMGLVTLLERLSQIYGSLSSYFAGKR